VAVQEGQFGDEHPVNVRHPANYFGIGMDTALPVPRSAIQIVSPPRSPSRPR
jgi:hypothetical protein